MPIHILIVDDSAVIRGLMTKSLSEDKDIVICGSAGNGEIAVRMAGDLKPDIIILDIEMPVMDGITALPLLIKAAPNAKIIMASTLTERNAEISLKALSLGAIDYLAKPTNKIGLDADHFYRELITKVKALSGGLPHVSRDKVTPQTATMAPAPTKTFTTQQATPTPLSKTGISAIAIASSTGGPQALLKMFEHIKGHFKQIPIFITQHMPPTFTTILADHLSKAGDRPCSEGKNGVPAQPGHAYLAPGDYHMIAVKEGTQIVLNINQDPPENFCRPAADPMLRSLSEIYGSHLVIVVLTGMGQDGLEGAKIAVSKGASVVAQDEASCVVYGMPKAVVENNLCRAVLPLGDIGAYLISQIETLQ